MWINYLCFNVIYQWNFIGCSSEMFASPFSRKKRLRYRLKSFKSTCLAVYIYLIWHLLSYCYNLTLCSCRDDRLRLLCLCCLDNTVQVTAAVWRCCTAAVPCWLQAPSSGGFTLYALYISPDIGRDMQTCTLACGRRYRHVLSLVASIDQCGNFRLSLCSFCQKSNFSVCASRFVFLLLAGRQSNLLRDVARVQCGYWCGHWLACGRTEGSQV